jgi:hypothetical protein
MREAMEQGGVPGERDSTQNNPSRPAGRPSQLRDGGGSFLVAAA